MNKKIIIPLIIVIVVVGLLFFIVGRKEVPDQLSAESIALLREEFSLIYDEALQGKITTEEANKKLIALEDSLAELIAQSGIKTEVGEYIAREKARQEAAKELMQWSRSRVLALDRQLMGIFEADSDLAAPLIGEFNILTDEIWHGGVISQQEADEKLIAFEEKMDELIARHAIEAEVDDYIDRQKAREAAEETAGELEQWAEQRMRAVFLHGDAIAEINPELFVMLEESLGEEFWFFIDELWSGEISQEEGDEKFAVFEEKIDDFIVEHGIKAGVKEYVDRIEAVEEWLMEAAPQLDAIDEQLSAIEAYLSE